MVSKFGANPIILEVEVSRKQQIKCLNVTLFLSRSKDER